MRRAGRQPLWQTYQAFESEMKGSGKTVSETGLQAC
jgi:hypothetical protein